MLEIPAPSWASLVKISIITPVFNAAATLEESIRSLVSQKYPELEYIVVDGSSTDGTLDLIRAHAGCIARFVSEPDLGIFDAMNKGLALATGEVVGFLHADDTYAVPEVLNRVAAVFSDSSVQACYSDLLYVDRRDPERIVRYWRSDTYKRGSFAKGWMPPHPTFFVRRSVYEQYGNFDLRYPIGADFELTLRLLEVNKIRSVYIPEIWVKMRTGGNSNNFRNVILNNLETYRACRKHDIPGSRQILYRKILSRIPQYFSRP